MNNNNNWKKLMIKKKKNLKSYSINNLNKKLIENLKILINHCSLKTMGLNKL
jgi:hypothetical protein